MDWFLYDNGLGHERVKICMVYIGFEILPNTETTEKAMAILYNQTTIF